MSASRRAQIGVFGGSGFYSFLKNAETVETDTPYGPPSAPPVVGDVGGRQVTFIPRHGVNHEFPPHKVPYRANVWAMKELGVERIFGPCAAGSLQRRVNIGDFVVCDQLVDRTWGRESTFYEGPITTHVSLADPYCPTMREVILKSGLDLGLPMRDRGTMVVIQGPRFSTRAESMWHQQMGWDLVGMTQCPEAVLARELELCYATVSLVTDHDAGVDEVAPVSHEEVIRVFGENIVRLRDLLFQAIPDLPEERDCPCATALKGARFEL